MNSSGLRRLARELQMLEKEPPTGVSAWPKHDGQLDVLEAGAITTATCCFVQFVKL